MEETALNVNEFSQEFDILYNNIASNQAPGLTEYEKSVFLTKAQDEIIKNYFTSKPNGNKYQEGIEGSSKRYSDFSCLITVKTIPTSTTAADSNTIDSRGKIIKLPTNLMISLNESFIVDFNVVDKQGMKIKAISNDRYQVIPVTLTEYQRLMSKPSNDPLKRQVWRLMGNSTNGNGSVEIIPHWKDVSYTFSQEEQSLKYTTNGENPLAYQLNIRYVRRPYPIILEDISNQGLTINGYTKPYGSSFTKYSKRATDSTNANYYITYIDNDGNTQLYSEISSTSVTTTWASNVIDSKIDTLNNATFASTESQEACELSKELHPEILQRAVELAKVFYTGQPADVINAGQRSE